MALKLDMEKGYDRMEWSFLLHVLKCFGSDDRWIGWVKQGITNFSFSVLLNGSPHGFLNHLADSGKEIPNLCFCLSWGQRCCQDFFAVLRCKAPFTIPKWHGLPHLFCTSFLPTTWWSSAEWMSGKLLPSIGCWSCMLHGLGKMWKRASQPFIAARIRTLMLSRPFVVPCKWKKMALNNKSLGLPLFIVRSKWRVFEDVKEKVLRAK